jgi:hypothetical protein
VNSTSFFGATFANISEFAGHVKTGLPFKLSDFEDSPPWAKASLLVNWFDFTTREQ